MVDYNYPEAERLNADMAVLGRALGFRDLSPTMGPFMTRFSVSDAIPFFTQLGEELLALERAPADAIRPLAPAIQSLGITLSELLVDNPVQPSPPPLAHRMDVFCGPYPEGELERDAARVTTHHTDHLWIDFSDPAVHSRQWDLHFATSSCAIVLGGVLEKLAAAYERVEPDAVSKGIIRRSSNQQVPPRFIPQKRVC